MKPLVLIVDDDSQMASLLKTMLELSDYPYIRAANAKEALSLFLSHQPQIVLLDLGLPDMDGVDVIKRSVNFQERPFWCCPQEMKILIRSWLWMRARMIIYPSRFRWMNFQPA